MLIIIIDMITYNCKNSNEFDLVSGTDINKHEIAYSVKLSTAIGYKLNLKKGQKID